MILTGSMQADPPSDQIVLIEEYDGAMLQRLIRANGRLARPLTNYHAACRRHGTTLGVACAYALPRGRNIGRRQPCVVGADDNKSTHTCMAYMPREERAWLAHGIYHDVDMVNAQPVIALQLFDRMRLDAHLLRAYVEQRDARLEEVRTRCRVSRDLAKQLIIRLCFHGSIDAWVRDARTQGGPPDLEYDDVPAFVRALQSELKRNMSAAVDAHPETIAQQRRCKPDSPNPVGSAFAYLSQDIERRCVEALMHAALRDGYSVGAIIYDGILIRRNGDEDRLLPRDRLDAWSDAIARATGFRLQLAEKPWDLVRIPGTEDVAMSTDADVEDADDDSVCRETRPPAAAQAPLRLSRIESRLRRLGLMPECSFWQELPETFDLGELIDAAVVALRSSGHHDSSTPMQLLGSGILFPTTDVRCSSNGGGGCSSDPSYAAGGAASRARLLPIVAGVGNTDVGGATNLVLYLLLGSADDHAGDDCENAGTTVLVGVRPSTLLLSVDGREDVASLRVPLPNGIDISHVHQRITSALMWFVKMQSRSLAVFEGFHRLPASEGGPGPGADVTTNSRGTVGDAAAGRNRTESDHPTNAPPQVRIELSNPQHPSIRGARLMDLSGLTNDGNRPINGKAKLNSLDAALQEAVNHATNRFGMVPVINLYYQIINGGHNNHISNGGHNNHVSNGGNMNVDGREGGGGEGDLSDFEVLRDKLLGHAEGLHHRKRDGKVYAPVPECPYAYRELTDYKKYINDVLRCEPLFHKSPRRFDELMKYLTNIEPLQLPELERDVDLLSFQNGVLRLSTLEFRPYADLPPVLSPEDMVARHHVPLPYHGRTDTPLLDRVLGHQFEPEVAELLCVMMGRLLYPLGAYDNWQVMPYLVGLGSTGKSTILKTVSHLFAPDAVGNLNSRCEEIFGMANIADKDVVIGRDMPEKLSTVLPQDIMQCMTSAEGVQVARKNAGAAQQDWRAPVVLASNHMPDYVNSGNNVSRRLVVFKFERPVTAPDEGLEASILSQELPNIACRFLTAYRAHRERVRSIPRGSFWASVPRTITTWQKSLAASTNRQFEFLEMDPEDRGGLVIERREGAITWLPTFKEAYEDVMRERLKNVDTAVLLQHGFRVSQDFEVVCLSCKQLAQGRGEHRCCPFYSRHSRTRKRVIYDMELQRDDD